MIRVLIVEDDPMVAELNRRYLERLDGFCLAGMVRNAPDALELLHHREVDLVLLDIFMPGTNGLELLSSIRQARLGVDVILVTAARDSVSLQTALRHGAVDYLIKPFQFSRFQFALQAYRRRVRLLDQTALSQEDLDSHLFPSRDAAEEGELPKGLDRNTLKIVWDAIRTRSDEFTVEDLSQQVTLSHVSLRKYLRHLQALDLLAVETTYGSIGRPVSRYRCLAPSRESI